ncbi:hypothetical protein ACP275_04G204300 [Erythranthe tilingii]
MCVSSYAWLFFLITCVCIGLHLSCSNGFQYYDRTSCDSDTNNPGTRYTCGKNSSRNTCRTFLVYRSNHRFRTISSISSLFAVDPQTLLSINRHVSFQTQLLQLGHEIVVPIQCSCSTGNFSHANFTYEVSESEKTTLTTVSCDVFEGLVKFITLYEVNVFSSSVIVVPLKCACPNDDDVKNGVEYLVTYPFVERDDTRKVGKKFNVSVEEIWETNHMDPTPTVYPNTTILVPLKNEPFLNLDFLDSVDPPIPTFLPTNPFEKNTRKISRNKKIYIVGSVVVFSLVVALLVACVLYVKTLNSFKNRNVLRSSSTPLSTNSCLSPVLRAELKYSLCMYSVEDLKNGTENFDSVISDNVYKGKIDGCDVMIKRMRFEEVKKVIDIHSKINHVNIVKLEGVCYDLSSAYLVYELPLNGSLRECLLSSNYALSWLKRTKIAFDIANGLYYLHYSVIPSYSHDSNVSAENIFLTSDWRAKIAVFGNRAGPASERVDVFSFGAVLLELVSGKGGVDGRLLREYSIGILGGGGGGGGNEGGCFDQLKRFVDPCLKDDYPIADALCLVVLGGSCVDVDPLRRPSMDDVIKILARMV